MFGKKGVSRKDLSKFLLKNRLESLERNIIKLKELLKNTENSKEREFLYRVINEIFEAYFDTEDKLQIRDRKYCKKCYSKEIKRRFSRGYKINICKSCAYQEFIKIIFKKNK